MDQRSRIFTFRTIFALKGHHAFPTNIVKRFL